MDVPDMTMLLDDPPPQLSLPASAPIDISASSPSGVLLSGGHGPAAGPSSASTSLPPPASTSTVPHATSNPMPIPTTANAAQQRILSSGRNGTRTPSPTGAPVGAMNGHEGPITPRNDAGPWVFDGSGVRLRAADGLGLENGSGNGGMGHGMVNSLEAAVTQQQQQHGSGGRSTREDAVS